ncbi:hypothetical protein KAT80_03215 [Candidatus Pacearchaeota archaeon]|nr:hypothetical protein [Candidatus Pacearchaeota archaeon]
MIFPSHPYDVEAVDMWDRVKECHEELFIKHSKEYENYMTAWDCYIAFCQDCDKHDECFRHSDWFTDLIEE